MQRFPERVLLIGRDALLGQQCVCLLDPVTFAFIFEVVQCKPQLPL